jgi:hypothetical protein
MAAAMQERHPEPPGQRIIYEILVQTSLGMEYERRKQQRQTADGKLLLEYVVQSNSENLRRLMPALTRRLRWHPLLGTPKEAKEEIAAEAGVALEERVSPIRRNAPDWLKERMRAALDGTMNKIPGNVRRAVLEHLETAKKRMKLNREMPEYSADGPVIPDQSVSVHPIRELIIQQELQSLPTDYGKIVEMLLQGYTHHEIGDALDKSRAAISQNVKQIQKSLSKLRNKNL